MKLRINKFLSLSGLGSRRKVEELVLNGKIKINGKVADKLALRIDTELDTVLYNNSRVKPDDSFTYIILNKPKGYITTFEDELKRPGVMDIIPERYRKAGVFPVGRLDMDTEGLLLFTNDGGLAQKLSRPAYKVRKTYIVQLDKPLDKNDKGKMEKGVFLHQIKVKTGKAEIEAADSSWMKVKFTITEGKKRQIRYTFQNHGYKVKKLKRISFGPLKITGIKLGDYRALKDKEIKSLKKLITG